MSFLPSPSQDLPAAHDVSLNKLSVQCVSDTALAVRVYQNQIGRVSVASFSCLAPNARQAQSRGHGGSHEIHKILTDVTKEQSPDIWRSSGPQGIQGAGGARAQVCVCASACVHRCMYVSTERNNVW